MSGMSNKEEMRSFRRDRPQYVKETPERWGKKVGYPLFEKMIPEESARQLYYLYSEPFSF